MPRLTFSSVRNQLTAAFLLTFLLLLLLNALIIHTLVSRNLWSTADAALDRELEFAAQAAAAGPNAAANLEATSLVPWFAIYRGPELLYQTEQWESTLLDNAGRLAEDGSFLWSQSPTAVFQLRQQNLPGNLRVIVARDVTAVQRTLDSLFITLSVGFGITILVAAVAGLWLAGESLRPARELARQARQISAESLSERLTVDNPKDEFGQLAAVFNDLLRRLEESFTQLHRFTSDASHQLRTPIAAMRSQGESALQSTATLPRYSAAIGSMLEQAVRLQEIVDDLLMLTRGESGQSAIQPEVFDAAEFLQDTMEMVGVLAEDRGLHLRVELEPRCYMGADFNVLRHAVLNIFDNAVRYTPEGGLIQVMCWRQGGEIALAVRDSGPGIPKEEQKLIFDRFYRGRNSETTSEGTGLGLAIARWSVEASGGTLMVLSETGKGAEFRMVFPAASPDDEPIPPV